MSLKAKLEAVIYAAEEPVTLNQLAALFAADALEWKAEQQAAADQAAEESRQASEPLPFIADGLEYLGLADTPAVYASSGADSESAAVEEPKAGTPQEAEVKSPEADPEAELVTPGEPAEDAGRSIPAGEPADIELEARRLARQRDREVKSILKQILDELVAASTSDSRGVEIKEIAGGYRMATKPECHDAVRLFVKSLKPALKLSLPALETLAVVAYKQPVTAPEVNEIRGVESGGVLGSLLARKLIATAGRKQVIGRPILYKTTKEFLLRFGLKDVSELPSMEEFEKMAAIELDESVSTGAEDEASSETAAQAYTGADGAGEDENAANLDSNSPSGEELAGIAEAAGEDSNPDGTPGGSADGPDVPDPHEIKVEEPVSPGPGGPMEAAPAEPEQTEQAETEADPHGNEEEHSEKQTEG